VVFIIDQINSLYNLTVELRNLHVKKWIKVTSCRVIAISSKNNTRLKYNDPIYNGITDHQSVDKRNMDDEISPEDRLCYVVECLLFELEKNGLERAKAI